MYQNKTLLEKLQKSKQANTFLHYIQVKQQTFNKPKHLEKWELDLNNNEINWPNVYIKNSYTSTIDNTFRNVQYKFINRIIPTSKSLIKYKIKNSNICDLCNMQVETIKHIF